MDRRRAHDGLVSNGAGAFAPVVPDPPPLGFVVTTRGKNGPTMDALAKETMSILRALKAEVAAAAEVPGEADFVALLVEPDAPLPAFPNLKDRAATALGISEDEGAGRLAVHQARKALRAAGAVLHARELVLSPAQFGYLGLESDTLRERLQILLETLVLDAERLRLRREGWEEPEDA